MFRFACLARTAAVLLVLSLCLCGPASAAQFSFGALGDVPYNAAEEPQLVAMIEEMNRQPLAFAIHVGDIKSSQAECSDALFMKRRDQFARSRHPFVYVPGDNEWTDCRHSRAKRYDPLERLAKLRELFFKSDVTLGERTLRVDRQTSAGYPEHLRWIFEDVLFATLNVPGPDNNVAANPEESRRRTTAVLAWMREAFRIANERRLPALVIALQDNLWSGVSGEQEILATLASEAQRYHGEVLVVHGDTHLFHFDRPLVDPRTGKQVPNVTRLEVFGSPFVNWVLVTVTTANGRARFSAMPWSFGAKPAQPASADR